MSYVWFVRNFCPVQLHQDPAEMGAGHERRRHRRWAASTPLPVHSGKPQCGRIQQVHFIYWWERSLERCETSTKNLSDDTVLLRYSVNQGEDIWTQLLFGMRYLDLRVCIAAFRLSICHGILTGELLWRHPGKVLASARLCQAEPTVSISILEWLKHLHIMEWLNWNWTGTRQFMQ